MGGGEQKTRKGLRRFWGGSGGSERNKKGKWSDGGNLEKKKTEKERSSERTESKSWRIASGGLRLRKNQKSGGRETHRRKP